MALINCPECNRQISEHAENCPECGLKLKTITAGMMRLSSKMEAIRDEVERDPEGFKARLNPEITAAQGFKIIFVLLAVCFGGVWLYVRFIDEPRDAQLKAEYAAEERRRPQAQAASIERAPTPIPSLNEYKKNASRIGEKSDPIYVKAFVKNPDKYAGQRVKVSVKVFKIEEHGGKALMNVYLSRDYEPAVVYYDGETNIYDGDVIMVYGDVVGRIEGENALGAGMSWPTIQARYLKKLKYEE